MNSKMKKALITTGSIGAMVAPIAAVVSCANGGDNWKYNDSKPMFDGTSGTDFVKDIKKIGGKEEANLSKLQQRIARFMYEKESEGSLITQKDNFLWKIHTIKKRIIQDLNSKQVYKDRFAISPATEAITAVDGAKLNLLLPKQKIEVAHTVKTDSSNLKDHKEDIDNFGKWNKKVNKLLLDANQDKIINIIKSSESDNDKKDEAVKHFEEKFKEIKDIEEKINKIDTKSFDRDASNFGSEYPSILTSTKSIEDKQNKILQDEKRAFISPFKTKAEGEEKWITQRNKKYRGASSDKLAVEQMVLQNISARALPSRKISLISSFTREQLLWASEKENNKLINGFHFLSGKLDDGFLVAENSKDANKEDRELSDKVWFYGTNSNIQTKKIVSKWGEWATSGSKAKYNLYKHILIKATPSPSGEKLPWVVDTATIERMFKPSGYDIDHNVFESIGDLWKTSSTNPQTTSQDEFIRSFSDNGVKTGGGSLGIAMHGSVAAGLNNGFSLGTLMTDTVTTTKSNQDGIYSKIQKAFQDAYDETFKSIESTFTGKKTLASNGTTVTKTMPTLTEFKQEFANIIASPNKKSAMIRVVGQKLRDALGAKNGRSLAYTDSDNRSVITSLNGIHLVLTKDLTPSISGVNSKVEVETQLKTELSQITEKKDASAGEYNLLKFMNGQLTQVSFEIAMIEDTPANKKFLENFEAFFKTLSDAERNNQKFAEYRGDIEKLLKRARNLKAASIAQKYASSNSKWLIEQYDKHLIDYTVDTVFNDRQAGTREEDILDPGKIYDKAYKIAGGGQKWN